MTHTMVVGTSEAQDFSLLDDGAVLVGTGFDVDIEWRGTALDEPPVVAWLSQAGGTVRVTACEDMPVGSHYFRFKLTDGAGQIAFVPNLDAAPNLWRVVRA